MRKLTSDKLLFINSPYPVIQIHKCMYVHITVQSELCHKLLQSLNVIKTFSNTDETWFTQCEKAYYVIKLRTRHAIQLNLQKKSSLNLDLD